MKNLMGMKSAISLASVAMFICGIVSASVLTANQTKDTAPADVVQWEFCSLRVSVDKRKVDTGRQILKIGREGWELVDVENICASGTTTETEYFFKRRL